MAPSLSMLLAKSRNAGDAEVLFSKERLASVWPNPEGWDRVPPIVRTASPRFSTGHSDASTSFDRSYVQAASRPDLQRFTYGIKRDKLTTLLEKSKGF